ncbi:hypothetical protein KR018_008660, partial [Drosophila ironensis]
MRVLGLIASTLSHWLQQRYMEVGFGCSIVISLTLFLEISLAADRDLIYWRDILTAALESSLLLPIALLGVSAGCKLILMAHLVADHCFPRLWLQNCLERRRRLVFADFIVRRLLLQLELTARRLPPSAKDVDGADPAMLQSYERARRSAYRAVEIFRRDAQTVLQPRLVDSNEEEDSSIPHYFVLEEEERALRRHGYGSLDLPVTEKLIRQLLRPPKKVLKSRK